MSRCSPAAAPINPCSSCGSIRPSPSTIATFAPLPPANSAPSMVPEKSMVTLSPAAAARSTGEYFICCLRSRSIMASTSLSVTCAVMRSSSSDSMGCSATSGKTSNVATYLRSCPSSMLCGSMRGLPAGDSCFSVTASAKLDCSSSPITSRWTCSPELLTDHGERRLARPKAVEARRAAQFLQTRGDFLC